MDRTGFLKFMKYAGRLKELPRKGWVQKVGIQNAESVADHTYRVALIAMVLAIDRGLNLGKALGMALLHDLQESITGDRTPEEERPDEEAAFLEVISPLSQDVREELFGLWKEYEEGKTEEARLVKQADKLEMAIQALEYLQAGRPRYLLREFLESAKKGVHDEELIEIMKVVQDEFDKD